jgi:signal transduction histidine kinase
VSDPTKVNILMVDDSPAKLLSYESVLSQLGENLLKALSADEALKLLLKKDVGVVLLDVAMPGIDGFQLAQIIREHPRFQRTPIIFISAIRMTDFDRVKGYERGAVDYISVPISPELLRAKVSVFVELHRSTRKLEQMNSELVRLSKSLIEAQDAERRRIARALHDGMSQDLIFAKMVLDGCTRQENPEQLKARAAQASAAIGTAIQQVRSLSYLLHPPMLDESGLRSALLWYVEGFGKRSGIETSIEIEPRDFPRLKPEVENAVFRIVQEALTNVLRHSEGTEACISLIEREGRVIATIRDNGKGIEHGAEMGVGMCGMKQRVKELGGEFRVGDGKPGTLIEIVVPIGSVPRPTILPDSERLPA